MSISSFKDLIILIYMLKWCAFLNKVVLSQISMVEL